MNPLDNAGIFLVSTVIDLYLFILALRFILCHAGVHYLNPFTQFIIRLTEPVIKPIKKIFPIKHRWDFPTLFIIIILELLKFFIICLIIQGIPNFFGLVLMAIGDILKLFLNIYFYAILASAILSWFNMRYHPAVQILDQITYPVLKPLQRYIPPVSGFDLSPIFALIGIQLLLILFVNPLIDFGTRVSLSL